MEEEIIIMLKRHGFDASMKCMYKDLALECVIYFRLVVLSWVSFEINRDGAPLWGFEIFLHF